MFSLKPSRSASDTANSFQVTLEGAAGQTAHFALLSLFPPTFKDRENGMRIDIAEVCSIRAVLGLGLSVICISSRTFFR